jgi:rhodanese-related sulfurtransferase
LGSGKVKKPPLSITPEWGRMILTRRNEADFSECGEMVSFLSHALREVDVGFLGLGGSSKNVSCPDWNASELAREIASGRTLFLLDVREPSEFASGHIRGAINIPLGTLASSLQQVPKDQEIVTICRSGRRSQAALETLRAKGYTKARNFLGGMLSWSGDVEK